MELEGTNAKQSFEGTMRVVCPRCKKAQNFHLESGAAITWCKGCQGFFRTVIKSEMFTAEERRACTCKAAA